MRLSPSPPPSPNPLPHTSTSTGDGQPSSHGTPPPEPGRSSSSSQVASSDRRASTSSTADRLAARGVDIPRPSSTAGVSPPPDYSDSPSQLDDHSRILLERITSPESSIRSQFRAFFTKTGEQSTRLSLAAIEGVKKHLEKISPQSKTEREAILEKLADIATSDAFLPLSKENRLIQKALLRLLARYLAPGTTIEDPSINLPGYVKLMGNTPQDIAGEQARMRIWEKLLGRCQTMNSHDVKDISIPLYAKKILDMAWDNYEDSNKISDQSMRIKLMTDLVRTASALIGRVNGMPTMNEKNKIRHRISEIANEAWRLSLRSGEEQGTAMGEFRQAIAPPSALFVYEGNDVIGLHPNLR